MCTDTLSANAAFLGISHERPAPGPSGGLKVLLQSVNLHTVWLRTIVLWCERAKQRRALLELDERLLSDIGVTRAKAIAEARKPFWKP